MTLDNAQKQIQEKDRVIQGVQSWLEALIGEMNALELGAKEEISSLTY